MPPPGKIVVIRGLVVPALLLVLLLQPCLAQTPREPEREQLLNGLRLLVWSQPNSPELLVKLRLNSGAAFDLAGKSGQMALLGDLLFPDAATVDYFTDELGGKLARDWVGREEVDEAIESNRSDGKRALTTTFAQCLSFQDCQDYVPKMFSYLQGSFQQAPPEGTFIAIVVACAGAATFFVPYEELADE